MGKYFTALHSSYGNQNTTLFKFKIITDFKTNYIFLDSFSFGNLMIAEGH